MKNDILAPNLEVNNRDNFNLANSWPTICGVNRPTRPIFRQILAFVFFFIGRQQKTRRFYQPSVLGFWQSVWRCAIVGVSHPTFYEKKMPLKLGRLSGDHQATGPSLKKCLFGIAYPGFHFVGRSVGFFFFNIYYLHMDGNGRKKNLRVAAKQVSWSALPNKLFFFIFAPVCPARATVGSLSPN